MDVIIVGVGSMAQVVVSILNQDRNLRVLGCVDVQWPERDARVLDVPVIGDHQVLEPSFRKGVRGAIVAVGNNVIREGHFHRLEEIGFELINAIHSSVVLGGGVTVGRGVLIGEGSVISSGSRVGDNVILEGGVVIGTNVDISPNAYLGCGVVVGPSAQLRRNCTVQVGATIAPEVTVGKHAVVAPGSSVRSDVADELPPEARG